MCGTISNLHHSLNRICYQIKHHEPLTLYENILAQHVSLPWDLMWNLIQQIPPAAVLRQIDASPGPLDRGKSLLESWGDTFLPD